MPKPMKDRQAWAQRGRTNQTLEQAVEGLSGITAEELLFPADCPPEKIENLVPAAQRLKKAIRSNEKICVFGDYDADGVCSMAILFLTISKMKELYGNSQNPPVIRAPKRMSEGYGLSKEVVKKLTVDLLITVDNGIAAIEEIKEARKKGIDVVVLDHHRPGEILPKPNILVDPYVNPQNNGFIPFCGAGLAYMLAKLLIGTETELMKKLSAIAAVGTIADVVPLHGANRVIVKEGLAAINERKITEGLKSLLEACQFTKVTEENIAFKLAPVLNAPGRLLDDGARYASGCISQDKKSVPLLAQKLVEINDKRKQMVADACEKILVKLPVGEGPVVVLAPELHEGILGIVAGKLADERKAPAYVFTGREELKGSGRSGDENIDLYQLTKTTEDLLLRFGGHMGAVGLSIQKENLPRFHQVITKAYSSLTIKPDNKLFYDMEITSEQVPEYIKKQAEYAPFGEGNPKPVFLIRNITLLPRYNEYVKYMGANKEHVRFTAQGFSLVGFGMSEKYNQYGKPLQIDVVGHIGINESYYGSFQQVEIVDFAPVSDGG